jgi:hypothetical protein
MRDTIDMARETGVAVWHRDLKKWQVDQNLKDFEALVRADEREVIAKVFEGKVGQADLRDIAAFIRARGNT